MNRRRVLLIVATFVVIVGVLLVFLYARGADSRAQARFQTVTVLKAAVQIDQGESIDDAAKNGKLTVSKVVRADLLPNAQTSIEGLTGKVALTTIYPGEQIISDKFGDAVEAAPSPLQIPDGDIAVSVHQTDPDRVAGFVDPGSKVAIFYTNNEITYTRLLLSPITVLGVGSTTVTKTTTTNANGEQTTTEELPRTLMTVAVNQKEAQKVIFGSKSGILTFGLETDSSIVKPIPPTTINNLFR